mmetsp:Transcript_20625/g.49095  ORF Transcript_20625/g.49095 Transcript_20625/m.49095 type:complete len:391 (-) Transcript_20625:239-1411(-)
MGVVWRPNRGSAAELGSLRERRPPHDGRRVPLEELQRGAGDLFRRPRRGGVEAPERPVERGEVGPVAGQDGLPAEAKARRRGVDGHEGMRREEEVEQAAGGRQRLRPVGEPRDHPGDRKVGRLPEPLPLPPPRAGAVEPHFDVVAVLAAEEERVQLPVVHSQQRVKQRENVLDRLERRPREVEEVRPRQLAERREGQLLAEGEQQHGRDVVEALVVVRAFVGADHRVEQALQRRSALASLGIAPALREVPQRPLHVGLHHGAVAVPLSLALALQTHRRISCRGYAEQPRPYLPPDLGSCEASCGDLPPQFIYSNLLQCKKTLNEPGIFLFFEAYVGDDLRMHCCGRFCPRAKLPFPPCPPSPLFPFPRHKTLIASRKEAPQSLVGTRQVA